jgi:phosphoserine phosphatase RsbU/P
MTALDDVFRAYRDATGCEMAVWLANERDGSVRVEAATSEAVTPREVEPLPEPHSPPREVMTSRGPLLVAALPGPRRAWLALGPCAPSFPLAEHLKFVLPVSAQYLQSALEVEHAANELAERYEEINLLYTISEILGRTVSMEEAASEILTEISDTVGARRAAILVHDRATDTLQAIAIIGADPSEVPIIQVRDDSSVSARVFRELHPVLVEDGEVENAAEKAFRRGPMLSVPILWTAPRGGEPIGVVNLSDRRSGQPFSAGDQKLIAAIATQIGTAIQNARLVRANVERQRLAREMQLAHDLQMRLLPAPSALAPVASVAARVVPAESVGGDFYNLFRLGDSRAGVMVGDVSGHGYPAALIMALTMSASAIHAQRTADPGETMQALLESLSDELETTEMFMSLLYAVVDRASGELQYANAGHPHAFVVRASGDVERLPATDPPLGMVPTAPSTQRTEFDPRGDVLLLFTDGVSDARDLYDERLGEGPVLEAVVRHRAESSARILDRIFEVVDRHALDARRRDDLTAVVLRG